MQSQSTQRIFQISYLRAFLTLLVVIHHSVLAYFSIKPPQWWGAVPVSDSVKWPGFDLLAGWNDIFFMALMFLVSGLFVWPGLQRYGAGRYIGRRLLRLGVPFAVGAGLLAPLAYYPAYLERGGAPSLGSYTSSWLGLGAWPAGPMWFLWVLLVFDCIVAISFTTFPRIVEAIARFVGRMSQRPMRLFLLLGTMSWVVYAPLSMHFGSLTWWGWGPFAVQTSRVLHYFIYFAAGVCLGASGGLGEFFERTGRLARQWWGWCLLSAVMFTFTIWCVRSGNGTAGRIGFAFSCAASSLFVTALVVRFVRSSRWADSLSANAYGIYLVHYVFVIWIQYLALQWLIPAFEKGLAVSLAAVTASWMTTALLRQGKIIAHVI
ncbi:MAG: acyltransferase [Terracidiphilus sp.]|jgi:peptidoglycan/LPS O-acetylase OafA/YrhL